MPLCEANEPIREVYFPISGVASLVNIMADETTIAPDLDRVVRAHPNVSFGSYPRFDETEYRVASFADREGFDVPADHRRVWDFTPDGVRRTLAGSLDRLGLDRVDIVLLHAITSSNWAQQYAGAMEALSTAKQRGVIRAHGTSCHSLAALRLAARTPWVEVDLARINPATIQMDADPATVAVRQRPLQAAVGRAAGLVRDDLPRLHRELEVRRRLGAPVSERPAASIGAREVLSSTAIRTREGAGTCVGRPFRR